MPPGRSGGNTAMAGHGVAACYHGMMNPHSLMPKAKVAVTVDSSTLELARLEQCRLAEECAKLAPAEEQANADLGREADGEEWPEY
jgi:hypothetical protein